MTYVSFPNHRVGSWNEANTVPAKSCSMSSNNAVYFGGPPSLSVVFGINMFTSFESTEGTRHNTSGTVKHLLVVLFAQSYETRARAHKNGRLEEERVTP